MRTHPSDRESCCHGKRWSRRELSEALEEKRGAASMRCVRKCTGESGASLSEEGWLDPRTAAPLRIDNV
jgi:hypothetical protein